MRILTSGLKRICAAACLVAFAFAVVAGVHGQQPGAQASHSGAKDIAGTWQGTLHAGRDLRTVVKITKNDSGGYKAVFYSIDQGGRPMPADSTSVNGSTVKMSLNMIGGTFEGNLSGDGNTMNGNFTQGQSLPLVLTRATPATEWTIPPPPPVIPPMAKDANPSFEVATIKPSQPDRPGRAFLWTGDRLKTINSTLMSLISFAYNLQQKQVIGAADWMNTEKFDLEGKPDTPGSPSPDQIRTMMQKLLVDRFQLKFHNEKRELSAYVLTVSEIGSKLTKDTSNQPLPGLFFRKLGDLNVRNATMGDFVHLMQSAVLDRPVVDQTGLTGRWDFELKWTPDDSQFGGMGMRAPASPTKAAAAAPSQANAADAPSQANAGADAPPPLVTALQEQLGLKLNSEKTSVDVMVIDHVDHPTPN